MVPSIIDVLEQAYIYDAKYILCPFIKYDSKTTVF